MATFAANAGDSGLTSFLLVYIGFPTPLYLCNADFDITTAAGTYPAGAIPGAQTWSHSRYFSCFGMSLGTADAVGPDEIRIDNADNYLSTVLFGAGVVTGATVIVYQALFPNPLTSARPDDVKVRVLRAADSLSLLPDAQRREAVIRLAPYRDLQALVLPRRHFSPQCTFQFKNQYSCQYTGADTACTRTKADCTAKSNIAHFGGFPMVGAAT